MPTEQVEIKPAKKLKRVNYALAATLLASGEDMADIAPLVGAKNANVLKVGLSKRGVTKKYANSLPVSGARAANSALQVAAQATDLIRDKLGGRLLETVSALSSKPVRRDKLANRGQGEAAVLKTLAETHRALYGGAESTVIVFGAAGLGSRPTPQDAIEVQAEATSNSVPDQPDTP